MSLIRMQFRSETLGHETGVRVILPLPARTDTPVAPLPVLYLLHGIGDDHTSWQRKSNVENYALAAGLAVVMPEGSASGYADMVHGQRYRTYIAEELPDRMNRTFPFSTRREDTFIAGCSMGGHGALKLGLENPQRYSAIGCFSGAHFEWDAPLRSLQAMLSRAYGGDLAAVRAKCEADARAAAAGEDPVRVWMGWGDTDELKTNAKVTYDFLRGIASPSLSAEGTELPGGHNWTLWDECLRRFIPWLGLPAPSGHPM